MSSLNLLKMKELDKFLDSIVSNRELKVLVCGGRHYANRETLDKTLDGIHEKTPIKLIIHGGAKGADSMARLWAIAKGIKHRPYYPDWKAHGFAAGPIRNVEMFLRSRPDLVVAFPGGKGTAHMVGYAKKQGATVIEINDVMSEETLAHKTNQEIFK